MVGSQPVRYCPFRWWQEQTVCSIPLHLIALLLMQKHIIGVEPVRCLSHVRVTQIFRPLGSFAELKMEYSLSISALTQMSNVLFSSLIWKMISNCLNSFNCSCTIFNIIQAFFISVPILLQPICTGEPGWKQLVLFCLPSASRTIDSYRVYFCYLRPLLVQFLSMSIVLPAPETALHQLNSICAQNTRDVPYKRGHMWVRPSRSAIWHELACMWEPSVWDHLCVSGVTSEWCSTWVQLRTGTATYNKIPKAARCKTSARHTSVPAHSYNRIEVRPKTSVHTYKLDH